MTTVTPAYQRTCPGCQKGHIRKKLIEDAPGCHTYILACTACQQEYGIEWEEPHHEPRSPVPAGDLP
jgi:hypothetical protein